MMTLIRVVKYRVKDTYILLFPESGIYVVKAFLVPSAGEMNGLLNDLDQFVIRHMSGTGGKF
jgi:hypothetical protein